MAMDEHEKKKMLLFQNELDVLLYIRNDLVRPSIFGDTITEENLKIMKNAKNAAPQQSTETPNHRKDVHKDA